MHPSTATPNCWSPIKNLLLKPTVLVAITAATLCGCAKSPRSFQEMTEDEQLNFLRAQADAAMLVQATNAIPHFHAMIEENAETFEGSVGQWRGWVRLDYVDPSGVIQQTNIPMTFAATIDGRLFASAAGSSGSALLDLR